jgi:O-antigen/teichoic acid export membrane protein
VGGSALAQGLVVITAPVIARLFAPEAFGIAALFTSIMSIVIVVSCLRYELSIMLPKTDEEAVNLLGLSVCSVFVISVLTGLLVFLASDQIAELFNAPNLRKYLWLIPPAVFIGGLFTALNHWNSRTKHFGRLSIARILSSTVAQTTKIGVGFAGFVSGGVLIATRLLGMFVSTGVLFVQIWRTDQVLFRENIRLKPVIAGLQRYKEFPIYSMWSAILISVSQQFPFWILAFYFPTDVVGSFAIGRNVIMLPLTMVGSAVTMVFFQKSAEAFHRDGELSTVVGEVFKRLVIFGGFILFLLGLIGEEVFVIAFGARWSEAGVYAQILALWMFTFFITSPISNLFYVFEKQAAFLLATVVTLSLRVLSLVVGSLSGNPRVALALFSGVSTLTTFAVCCWLLAIAGVPMRRIFDYFGKFLKICMPILGMIALSKWVFKLNPLGVVSVGFFGAVIYYAIILKNDKILMDNVTMLFKRFRHT